MFKSIQDLMKNNYNEDEKIIIKVNADLILMETVSGKTDPLYKTILSVLREKLSIYFKNNKTGLIDENIDKIQIAPEDDLKLLVAYIVTKKDFNLVRYQYNTETNLKCHISF